MKWLKTTPQVPWYGFILMAPFMALSVILEAKRNATCFVNGHKILGKEWEPLFCHRCQRHL